MARITLHRNGRHRNGGATTTMKWILFLLFFLGIYITRNWLEDTPQTAMSLLEPIDPSIPVRPEEILDHPDTYLYPRRCSHQDATMADLQACYPTAPLYQPPCASDVSPTEPLTWKFIDQCISGRRSHSNNITQIHVIGERNSGTKWLQQTLEQCFPRQTTGVRSHRDFLRSKHFFQPPAKGNLESSLIVAIVRDPIEWVAAMREKPYHMPHHMAGFDTGQMKMPPIPLEWDEFMARPTWTLPQRSPSDLEMIQNHQQSATRCFQAFAWDEVIPCYFDNTTIPRAKWRGHVPIYELQRDHSGDPFEDLLKLRSQKALNFFLEVPLLMSVGGFLAVRYEDLVRDGTRSFLARVAQEMWGWSELPAQCRPQPPKPERLGQRTIPEQAKQWIEERLVLETEQMLGYR